jgi:hypothetical protein
VRGPIVRCGAAASASLALAAVLERGDPLRGTLLLLPWIVAGLAELGALPGARRVGGSLSGTIETLSLAALVLLAAVRSWLALPLPSELLAAGLAGWVLLAALRRGLGLRPLLGRRLPRRPPVAFFLLPLLVYLALQPWVTSRRLPDGDEPYYLLVAHSLAYDLDDDLANNYAEGDSLAIVERRLEPQPGDPTGSAGELYSRHNLLLPLLLAPAYRWAGVAGAQTVMALLAAALCWVTLRLARHYFRARPGPVLVAWLFFALLSPLLLYAPQVWVEVPAALLSVIALDHLLELKYDRLWNRRRWLGVGMPLLLLPLLKIRFLLLAVPLLALAWWHAGRPRKPLIVLGVALALLSGALLAYNAHTYGNPLKIHSVAELGLLGTPPVDYLLGGAGLLFDAGFGLFAATPVWLLVVPALALLVARRHPLLFDLAVFSIPYLLLVSGRREWYGGWSPPFRYALVALPLLALALAPLLEQRRRLGARWLLGGLAAATLALLIVWTAVPGWTYNFADGRTLLVDQLGALTGADVARLTPSMLRPRPATWVVPLLLLATIPALWTWPRRRSGPSAGGCSLALLALAALPFLASHLPTRTVELEDAWVAKSGGHVHPDRWQFDRTRFRGGWVLREGEQASVRPVAGGGELSVAVELEWVRNTDSPLALELRAGERILATWHPSVPRLWERVELGPFPWRPGEELVFAVTGPATGPTNGLILDRAELSWR